MLSKLMDQCMNLAKKAEVHQEVPVGAILYSTETLEPVSKAFNLRESLHSSIAHAEVLALHRACKKQKRWRLNGLSMLVTLEPCVMCYGAILQSRLDGVYWATSDPKGGAETAFGLHSKGGHNHSMDFRKADLGFEESSSELLKSFFRDRRNSPKKK